MPKTKSRRSKRRDLLGGLPALPLKPPAKQISHKVQTADEVDENIAHMDVRLLADLFARQIKRHYSDLTAVEMNDLYMPSGALRDTSDFSSPRHLDSLASFVADYTAGGKEALSTTCEQTGSPHTILVTSSGIRAADLTRAVRIYQTKEAMVAKLFAKHIKLEDAIKNVQNARIGIGIGTPARVNDLLELKALKTDNLKRIVIDGSYIDQKKRTIFDMRDLFQPLLRILRRPEFIMRYGDEEDGLEVMVF